MLKNLEISEGRDRALATLVLAIWFSITLVSNLGNWPPDLSAMYFASHFFELGQQELVYAAPDGFFGPSVESWLNEATRLGHGDQSFFPYVYPPIWAAIFAPITNLTDAHGFFNFFYLVQIGMITSSVVLTFRIIRPSMPLAVWCLLSCFLLHFSLISISALHHNQFQITVTFLVILSLERYATGHMIAAGVALGLAAAIKITPAGLGIIFLLNREYRAAIATTATGLIMLALSVAICGVDLHLQFFHRLSEISEQVVVMHVNYNLEAAFMQLSTLLTGIPLDPGDPKIANLVVPEPQWLTLTIRLLFVVGVAAVLWRTRKLDRQSSVRIVPVALLIVMTLCAPVGWSHHYLPVLLLVPVVYTFMLPIRATALLAIFGLLTSLRMFVFAGTLSSTVHPQVFVNVVVMLVLLAIIVCRPKLDPAILVGETSQI